MNAAAPQFGATGLVHLRDKDILSSVSRKFSGLPDEAARWFREITTFMDKHDLGPYKDAAGQPYLRSYIPRYSFSA